MTVTSSDYQNIQRAVSGYAEQARTDAVKISGTALVGSDARINVNAEDFYGSIRWNKELGALAYGVASGTPGSTSNVNISSQTDVEGTITTNATDVAEFIKTARNVGADEYLVTQLITQQPGSIATVGSKFGDIRARDEDAAVVAVVKGVVASEVLKAEAFVTKTAGSGAKGQTDPDTLLEDGGFYYDVNSATNNATAGTGKLIDTSAKGGSAAVALWKATAAAFSDLEPEFFYLFIQPSVFEDMRSSNLLDQEDRITDGNIQFATIMAGMFRLVVSRTGLGTYNLMGSQGANQPVNAGSVKTSVLALPGAVSFTDLAQNTPVEFDNDASKGTGSGKRDAWYRWGYVMHPRGYTWSGSKAGFAVNTDVTASRATASAVTGYDYAPATAAQKIVSPWTRKENVGNLGILPIFHA